MLKKIRSALIYLVIIAVSGFAIFYTVFKPNLGTYSPSKQSSSALSTQALFAAHLPSPEGKNQALNQWQGKIIVLNFWATWCPPCREEMPELSALNIEYQNRNVVVIGIAIDEMDAVKAFVTDTKLDAIKVSYPLLVAEVEGMGLASGLGNAKGVLPFTLIIKPDGAVAKSYFGRVTKPLLEEAITKLL
ncbi:MAG: TlpA family protein disulfide reductase [Methylophilaceae bacterium]|nr:TlpA family protein disulfide reductase [Methylophilaceae bacterium]